MKIDIHTHGKLTKRLPFSAEYTHWLFSEARAAGLNAICLTEHFNTLGFEELYRYIEANSVHEGDTLLFEGLRIFPGMETDIAEGGHVLTLGNVDAIISLQRHLAPYREDGHFLPFSKLRDIFDEYPVYVGAGHPFRGGEHIPDLPDKELARFDFFDLNGVDVAHDPEGVKRNTYALAGRFGKPVLAGSDTHEPAQYGTIMNIFPDDISTVPELLRKASSGEIEITVHPYAAFKVKTAGLLKRALKEIYALGGDYVGIVRGRDPAWTAYNESASFTPADQ